VMGSPEFASCPREFQTAWRELQIAEGPSGESGPQLLADWWDRLGVDCRRAAVASVWTMTREPTRFVTAATWLRWLDAVGYFSVDRQHHLGSHRLTQSTPLYRGATPERSRGLAWSVKREVAETRAAFCRSEGLDGKLYSCVVEPTMILAVLECRDEWEVLVRPEGLDRMREII